MDESRRTSLSYSLTNIPIPSPNAYRKRLIEKVESVIKRMRWRAFYFLREGENSGSAEEKFGLKSKKCPPQIEELKPFEDDMIKLIENIDFRRVSDPFQDNLKKDIRSIKSSNDVSVRADKTRNLYKIPKDRYSKLLRENITKHYKSAPEHLYDDINDEAQRIASRLKLDDRMEVLAKSDAFLTLKDHKENFATAWPCRLINPAKPEMGKISKNILDGIVNTLREKTRINLWRNTAAVIDWFRIIEGKEDLTFLCFDIVDFYPSITEDLLRDALTFARKYVDISDDDMNIIFHSRKSLLFENGKAWMKREKDGLFDVTMGSYDGAEVCELVGAYLLNKLAEHLDKSSTGLYRDDGLAALRGCTGHAADATRKKIIRAVKELGLRITIEVNLKVVNFLDVTLNLNNGRYHPYRKPNDNPLYINKLSNHPPRILENLPAAISKRVSDISCDQQAFSDAAPMYEQALVASGFQGKLRFTQQSMNTKKRKRQRNVIWFNPPFSKSVSTNVARRFLQLVSKHFPKASKLHKIFNRNTLKVSYSCMPNMASIISTNNRMLCREPEPTRPCNCRAKDKCPLDGKCQTDCIVYKAVVTNNTTGASREYIGLTEPPFKQRYANHLTSIRHEKYENSTELSKYVWELKRRQEDFSVKWRICNRARPYNNQSKRCDLCLTEKLRIMTSDKSTNLNKKSELVSKCRHANKFCLSSSSKIT